MKNNLSRKLLQFSLEIKDNLISDIQELLKEEKTITDIQRSLINYVIDSSVKTSTMNLSEHFVDEMIKEIKNVRPNTLNKM